VLANFGDTGLPGLETRVYVSLGKKDIAVCADLTRFFKIHKVQVAKNPRARSASPQHCVTEDLVLLGIEWARVRY
jgi:hypothetical protein